MICPNGDDLLLIKNALKMPLKKACTNTSKAKIEEIMNKFDFEKVHKTMIFLKWSWRGGVPNMRALKAKALELLNDIASSKPSSEQVTASNGLNQKKEATWSMSIQTGGLKASKFGGTNTDGPWENFSLYFNVAGHATE